MSVDCERCPTCRRCKGTGHVFAVGHSTRSCPHCEGRGRYRQRCEHCNGTGKTTKAEAAQTLLTEVEVVDPDLQRRQRLLDTAQSFLAQRRTEAAKP